MSGVRTGGPAVFFWKDMIGTAKAVSMIPDSTLEATVLTGMVNVRYCCWHCDVKLSVECECVMCVVRNTEKAERILLICM